MASFEREQAEREERGERDRATREERFERDHAQREIDDPIRHI